MTPQHSLIRVTNCRLAVGDKIETRDLWIDRGSGKIIDGQRAFFGDQSQPSETYDLGGRIVAPGFLDVQINGAFGFDYSVPDPEYARKLRESNRRLIETGVTSFLPTITSQRSHIYHSVLKHLGRPRTRNAVDGTESLGAHCEGPFINPERHGIHKLEVLLRPNGLAPLEACYGAENLTSEVVKKVTVAAELDATHTVVTKLAARGIVVSIGHSASTYEQMYKAVEKGATMITHLFNAMNQPHHRDAGIVGILGAQNGLRRPFFGIIADDIHVHPSMVKVAYTAHPDGCILVTDAMAVLGLPDGDYTWTNGEVIEKKKGKLTLKGTDGKIAGSSVTLIECLNNLLAWTNISIPTALKTVTSTPARMLRIESEKGMLIAGADADLVVLSESSGARGRPHLTVDEVWKFGIPAFKRIGAVQQDRAKL